MNDTYALWGPIVLIDFVLWIFLYKDSENINVLFLLYGVLLLTYGFVFLHKIKKTFSWKKITAIVLSIKKNKIIILEPGVQDIAYQPCVKYQYSYNKNNYVGKTLSIIHNDFIFRNTQGLSAKDGIDIFLDSYSSNKHNVEIWINPKNPNESTLLQGAEKKTIYKYIIIICLGYINIGVATLIHFAH